MRIKWTMSHVILHARVNPVYETPISDGNEDGDDAKHAASRQKKSLGSVSKTKQTVINDAFCRVSLSHRFTEDAERM